MVDILVPISLFAMVVAIVWLSLHFGSKKKANILETVREAARNGQQLTPEVIQALGAKKDPNGDLKSGGILIAIALAFITLGATMGATVPQDEVSMLMIMTGVAAFPGFIGLVLLGFGWVNREKNAK